MIRRFAPLVFSVTLVLTAVPPANAAPPGAVAPYPNMAPIGRYLMSRSAEIALAESAAPSDISTKATVLVLDAHGYRTAHEGTNGFTCLVERGWMSPFDATDFWNPKLRGPVCYNPAASATVLSYTLNRTNLVLAGVPKDRLLEEIRSSNKLPAPAAGSMSYMMSRGGYLGDHVGHWVPHLMFHAPKAAGARDGASWGADSATSPVMLDTSHHVNPEPQTIFMLPVPKWSDGTAAPKM